MTSSDNFTPGSREDRIAGAIFGAFIGDALGLGPHWYYDLGQQYRDYGQWVSGYTAPKPDRYHGGMEAGELSQTGIIMELMLKSLADRGRYDEADFTRRLDEELLSKMDGTPYDGPGGYTNHSIRQAWTARIREGKAWGQSGGHADTSEAAERLVLLAAVLADDPREVARQAARCCRLTQSDSLVVQQAVAFALVVAALVRGEALDEDLSDKLMDSVDTESFSFVSEEEEDSGERTSLGFASPDALLLPSWVAQAARDPEIRIEPAWKVSVVYGMSCAINYLLPAAYYLAARFPTDFESAVLHALNGGGQNMSRACLTGALSGAQVGLSGIPRRFVEGLKKGPEINNLIAKIISDSK